MPDLDFTIRTRAELAGAEETEQSLESQIGKAKALGRDYSELSKQHARVKESLQNVDPELRKTNEDLEKMHTHLEGGRMMFSALDRIVPGLGHALHAAFSGPLGPVILFGVAIGEVYKKIEEVNTELADLEKAEFSEHQAAIERVWKGWDDARLAVFKYEEAIKTAGEDKDPAASHLKRIHEISAAQTAAATKEIEELGKVQVAWLKAHGATAGQIAAAEGSTGAAVERIRAAAANKNLGDIEKDIAGRKERQSDFDATQAAEANRVARIGNQLESLKSDKGKLSSGEDVKKLDDLITEKSAALERLNAALESEDPGTLPYSFDTDTKNRVQSELDAALKRKDVLQRRAEQIEKEIANLEREKIAAEAALEKVSSAGAANRGAIRAESEELKTGRLIEPIKEESAQRLQSMKVFADAVELLKGKDLNSVIASGATAQDDMKRLRMEGFSAEKIQADYLMAQRRSQTPGAFTNQDAQAIARYQEMAADKAAIADLNLLLRTLGENSLQMVAIIRQHQNGTISLAQEIAKLQAANASLQNQLNALGVSMKDNERIALRALDYGSNP